MPTATRTAGRLADRILAAADAAASTPPITDDNPDFGLQDAYKVAFQVIERRIARGETPVGWKIGFTNRTIWDEYGVHAPIWGPIYDSTLQCMDPAGGAVPCSLRGLVEPRIEPEIAFRVAKPLHPEMDARELLGCIDAVAHGFEIVQSLFPAWRFRAADTVAAFALHGCYRRGPLVPIGPDERAHWFDLLENFEIALLRDGAEVDRGHASNVLGGPLHALGHLVRGLADHPLPAALKPGDLVTTGTVTRAFPVKQGERWSTKVIGLPLPGMDVVFT